MSCTPLKPAPMRQRAAHAGFAGGWYPLAESGEVGADTLLRLEQQLIVYRSADGSAQVATVQGSVWSGIDAQGLRIDTPALRLSVREAHIAVDAERAVLVERTRVGLARREVGEVGVAQREDRRGVRGLRFAHRRRRRGSVDHPLAVGLAHVHLHHRAELGAESGVRREALAQRAEHVGCRGLRVRCGPAAVNALRPTFCKNSSFCEAITLPEILSLPVVNSFIGFALPDTIAWKSASLSSSVHSGRAVSPADTLLCLRSTVYALSGAVSLKR